MTKTHYTQLPLDLVGQTFSRLTVLAYEPGRHPSHWRCQCECGNETIVLGKNLKKGNTRSCGCLKLSKYYKGPGTRHHSAGYVCKKAPHHPRADSDGYVYEHILVAEAMIGRFLIPGEMVHHLDHDKANNSPENLCIAPSPAHHLAYHRTPWSQRQLPDEENSLAQCKCGCGNIFLRYDGSGRPRIYLHGHNGKKPNSIYCQGNKPNRLVECACGCKEPMWLYAEKGRIRRYIHGHNGRNMGLKQRHQHS